MIEKILIYIRKKHSFLFREKYKKIVVGENKWASLQTNKHLILFLLFIFFIFICILFISLYFPIIIIKYSKIIIDNNFNEEEYLKRIYNFIKLNFNGILINNKQKLKKIENPKISIIITVHNGEGCLKIALRSVQNQDFKEIEIIIVDDDSQDGSINLIKELMNNDPRIVLLQNYKNKGALYSKTKGVLNAKGKYVMVLDVDDLYAIENAFSSLYEEAEKNKLDILGFTSIQGNLENNTFINKSFHNDFETPIISQPELSERSYIKNKDGKIIGVRDVIWCYIFKTEFFKKVIKEIDLKFLNRINNSKDDIFIYFLLVKKARNLKHIKKIFYVTIQKINSKNPLIIYFSQNKYSFRSKYGCIDNISYIELVLIKSNNNFEDKKIASFAIEYFLLNNICRRNFLIKKEAIEVCKLYLENEYIERNIKEKINAFLLEINGISK